MVDPSLVSLVELGMLTVGVVIAVMEIRNMSQTRKAEVALQYFNKFTPSEFQEQWRHVAYEQRFDSSEEWGEKYGATVNPEAYTNWAAMITLFNAAGHMLRKGFTDLEDIHNHAMPIAIVTVWEKFKPITEDKRKRYDCPDFLESFEYLYDETRKKYPRLSTSSPYK